MNIYIFLLIFVETVKNENLVEHSIEQPLGPNFQVILDLTRGPVILGNYQHSLLAAIMGKLFYFFLNFNTSYDILNSNP